MVFVWPRKKCKKLVRINYKSKHISFCLVVVHGKELSTQKSRHKSSARTQILCGMIQKAPFGSSSCQRKEKAIKG